MNNVFQSLVETLSTTVVAPSKITRDDYERFCYEYLFDCLRDVPFGLAFCNKFSIHDNLLLYTYKNEDSARRYIEHAGYIEA